MVTVVILTHCTMRAFRNILPALLIALLLLNLEVNADKWQLYSEHMGIRIEYKYADCDLERGFDQEWVLLKITNYTKKKKTIAWKSNLWFNERCKTCDVKGQEYQRSFTLDGGKSLKGTCSVSSVRGLTIFVKFIDDGYKGANPQALTKFELVNIKVTDVD